MVDALARVEVTARALRDLETLFDFVADVDPRLAPPIFSLRPSRSGTQCSIDLSCLHCAERARLR
jgi:hypothetical protein